MVIFFSLFDWYSESHLMNYPCLWSNLVSKKDFNFVSGFFSLTSSQLMLPVGQYRKILVPYILFMSQYCIFLVSLRITKRFLITNAGPPLMFIFRNRLNLSSAYFFSSLFLI